MDMGKPAFRGCKTQIKEKVMKTKYEVMGDRPFVQVPVFDERLDTCPLDARGALVYGYLVHLARRGNSSSRTKIATSLRMEKSAVDTAVRVLIAGGAVVEGGRILKATMPSGASRGWFRYLKEPTREEWYDGFVYDRVYLPRSSTAVSLKTNALYWHLVKLGFAVDRMPGCLQVGGDPNGHPKYLTISYLAKAIRVYRKTVTRSLKALQELDLVRVQFKSRKRFVCGLPPIGTNASLWRESWARSKKVEVEVTAESLFGLPSTDVLKPSIQYDAGAGRFIRAYGIRGKVNDEIVAKIIKHRIEPNAWRSLVAQAHLEHQANKEKKPGRYQVDHCGFLFKHMLDEYIKGEDQRRIMARERSPMTSAQMQAQPMLKNLGLKKEMVTLLNHALESEEIALRGQGCIPCRLNWESVLEVLKEVKGDFEAFKVGVAKSISFSMKGDPNCDWFDSWMGMKQLPRVDDSPMRSLGLDSRSQSRLRTQATQVAERKVGTSDEGSLNRLANSLIRLACWQAQGKRPSEVEAGIEYLEDVLFHRTVAEGEIGNEAKATASPMGEWIKKLEGVSVW